MYVPACLCTEGKQNGKTRRRLSLREPIRRRAATGRKQSIREKIKELASKKREMNEWLARLALTNIDSRNRLLLLLFLPRLYCLYGARTTHRFDALILTYISARMSSARALLRAELVSRFRSSRSFNPSLLAPPALQTLRLSSLARSRLLYCVRSITHFPPREYLSAVYTEYIRGGIFSRLSLSLSVFLARTFGFAFIT